VGAQPAEQLQIRMNRRLHGIDSGIPRPKRKRLVLAGL
jgi:hypothetical protein